jgi:hypothetical protein
VNVPEVTERKRSESFDFLVSAFLGARLVAMLPSFPSLRIQGLTHHFLCPNRSEPEAGARSAD